MLFMALSLEGTRKSAVQIEPNIIYRIGRRSGLEFHSDDESIELAHATITLIAGGIVRLAAVAGKVYVQNGEEVETKSINVSDIVNDFVDLRFGNVNAKLYLNDGKQLDNEAAHDSSGYEEGHKNKSVNTSTDSFVIPESRPQSANTTRDEDSFNIPETQAISFTRPSRSSLEVSKKSLGDDFLIPETQDLFAYNNKPVAQLDPNILEEDADDVSELGTQIRICTQEFNEIEEDAIDDFDSSLLLGEGNLAVFNTADAQQTADTTNVDNEMSALNWSASNSKLNSTKADEVSTLNEACLTPDLSAALDDVPCTPDIFDFLKNNDLQSSGSPTPEIINVNADVHSISSNQIAAETNKEQPLIPCIETPETTPADPVEEDQASTDKTAKKVDSIATQAFENVNLQLALNSSNDEDNEDFIKTQAFPGRKSFTLPQQKPNLSSNSSNDEDNEDFIKTQAFPGRKSFSAPQQKSQVSLNLNNNEIHEDFIATQAFPGRKSLSMSQLKSKTLNYSTSNENNEDNIATQAFPGRKTFLTPLQKSKSSTNSNSNEINEDFIATQAFPGVKSFLTPKAKPKPSLNTSIDEDFIPTQAFPGIKSFLVPQSTPKNPGCIASITTEDLQETELFVGHKNTDLNNGERLLISDSISICDDLDRELKEFIAISAMPSSSSSDEEPDNIIIKPSRIQGKKLANKLNQSKANVEESDKPETSAKLGGKRFALRSESLEAPPLKIKRTRKTSEPPTPTKPKTIAKSRTRKRTQVSEEPTTPPKKMRSQKSKDSELVDKEETNDAGNKSSTKAWPFIKVEKNTSMRQKETIKETKDDDEISFKQKLIVKVRDFKSEMLSRDEVKPEPVPKRRTRKASQETVEDNIPGSSKDAVIKKGIKRETKKNTQKKDDEINKDNIKKESVKVKKIKKESATVKNIKKESSQKESSNNEEPSGSKSVKNTENAKGTRKIKLPQHDPLKVISDYICKIKSSGRKILIALSMCQNSELNPILYSLRNVVETTENPLMCDILIMDKGNRTYKFLVAIATNLPILSTCWLHSIKETRSIEVKPNHIFKDAEFEKTFKFNPLAVMEHTKLLKDYHFMLAKNIQPTIKEMQAIIEGAGGTVHSKPPPIASKVHLYVVASPEDKYIFRLLRNYTDLHYIKSEGVMQALVQHKPELLSDYELRP